MRRHRGRADAELSITGRNVSERELALRFAADLGTWELLGDAQEWAMSPEVDGGSYYIPVTRVTESQPGLEDCDGVTPKTRHRILELLREQGRMKPKNIAESLDTSRDAIRQAVSRMARDGQLVTAPWWEPDR